MTAPQPSTPEDCAAGIVVHLAAVAIAMRSPEQGTYADAMKVIIRDAISARDAALLAPLREEVERLRENNRKLNERATKAEGAVKITVEDCRRQGVSLGRALANAGYAALEAEVAPLRAEVERLTQERDEAVKLVPDLRKCLGTAHARAERAEAENALLRAEATAHMENARAAVAENARLREALRPFIAEAMSKDDIMHDTMNPDYHLECTVTVAEVRAAARALAEGGGE